MIMDTAGSSTRRKHSDDKAAPPTKKPCIFGRVRGSELYCMTRDSWETVTAVKLRTETEVTPFSLMGLVRVFKYTFKPHFVFDLDGPPIFPVGSRGVKEDYLTKILCEAVGFLSAKVCVPIEPVTSEGNPGVGADEAESGDEAPPSNPTPKFTVEELAVLNYEYPLLHQYYHEAKLVKFMNAQGKYFVTQLLMFLLPPDFECRLSTSLSGDSQPGALEVTWRVETHYDRQAASNKHEAKQERVADVVAYHKEKQYYTVVVEVKSDGTDTQSQHLEKMVGLFHPNQKIMLGLSIHPSKIRVRVLERSEQELHVIKFRDLPHTSDGLGSLAALVVAVSRNTLDY